MIVQHDGTGKCNLYILNIKFKDHKYWFYINFNWHWIGVVLSTCFESFVASILVFDNYPVFTVKIKGNKYSIRQTIKTTIERAINIQIEVQGHIHI